MKKNIPYLIIIIMCILITITSTVIACSNSRAATNPPKYEGTGTAFTTSTEIIELPTHNAISETTVTETETAETEEPTETTTETETKEPTETTTETETEEPTETTVKVTEPPIIETEAPIITTEAPPEIIETEEETEEETTLPLVALEYESYGNGTCAVIGIGNVTDTYIVIPSRNHEGDIVIAIEDNAFYGHETVRAIEIPSTIATIGELAFADCPELVYISVDRNNRLFTDVGGILYSIDMTKLIAFPAASGASSITISTSVTNIAAMAFYECNNLKAIIYEGSLAGWSKISVGEMNYGLYTASIVCMDTK